MALLSNAIAARSWNLYEGMKFSRTDTDEFLLNLHLYISHRAKRTQWTAFPIFRRRYDTRVEDVLVLSSDNSEFESSWKLRHESNTTDFNERKRLVKIKVFFTFSESLNLMASVTHMIHGDGFYYIAFFRWVARCSSVEECVALFDGIARDIKGLVAVADQHRLNRDVMEHFVRECLPLEQNDMVRVAFMRRRIVEMRSEVDGFVWILGQ
jgi:hypothetical protein